jgi:hypothetical protein
MNCQNHPEVPATAYCRSCGKPICDQCRRDAYGTVFCAEHAPVPPVETGPAAAPFTPGPRPAASGRQMFSDVSPGLAFFLGWIPGVGAIYNGQYAKGLVHAVVFGIMCSILDSNPRGLEVVFAMMLTAWMFYMAFEAYHTAKLRRAGEPVDEYSSLIDLRSRHHVPVAGVVLILLGVVMLLHTLNVLNLEYVVQYWPVLLIAAGVYLLYVRFAAPKEASHERR